MDNLTTHPNAPLRIVASYIVVNVVVERICKEEIIIEGRVTVATPQYKAELRASQPQRSVLHLFPEKLKRPSEIVMMKGHEATIGETNNVLSTERFEDLVQYLMKLLAKLTGVENIKNISSDMSPFRSCGMSMAMYLFTSVII